MSDRQQPRDLTPQTSEGAPQWKVVGLDLAHRCTFCGGPSEATLGCPDETAPVIFQIGVCNSWPVDCVMRRFREVKHERIAALAKDMNAAANEIVKLRTAARWTKRDPAELRAEEPGKVRLAGGHAAARCDAAWQPAL